jgi:LDH2 family malate/lactate/ureidoglycolate dehydrogenase
VIAINPNIMGDQEGFLSSASLMCDRVKNAKKLPETRELYLPGERGDELERRNLESGTLDISEEIFAKLKEMAI